MPKPSQSEIDLFKKLMGESRGFVEFLQSFASKSLAMACIGFFMFATIGLATMESDALFAARMYALAAALAGIYIATEAWKKVAALKVLQSRAITTDLPSTIEKVGG